MCVCAPACEPVYPPPQEVTQIQAGQAKFGKPTAYTRNKADNSVASLVTRKCEEKDKDEDDPDDAEFVKMIREACVLDFRLQQKEAFAKWAREHRLDISDTGFFLTSAREARKKGKGRKIILDEDKLIEYIGVECAQVPWRFVPPSPYLPRAQALRVIATLRWRVQWLASKRMRAPTRQPGCNPHAPPVVLLFQLCVRCML